MTRTIGRAVVIGSGTMGGGIAAHFANAGVPVYLLDVTQEIVKASYERLKKSKPPAYFVPEAADLVTIGNLTDHEAWIGEGDWIVEAIVEDLDAKRELFLRVDRIRKPGSIVSSNTSGLPMAKIAPKASDDFRKHFLGTHFFNPPRYMKLLEVIPTGDTAPEVAQFVREFAEQRLGKGVVVSKDTPNFIANRLASIGAALVTDFVLEHGYTVEETDAIAGPLIGRPKTAAFRLQDLVGLDVSSAVAANLYPNIEGDESREILRSPRVEEIRKSQMEKGRLGDKSGQGFYKKERKAILTLDLESGEYRQRREPEIASLAEAWKIRGLPERLAFVLRQDDKAGALARHIIYNALGYASRRVPEISDDLVSVDRAVRWGFSHELGPFELWDAIGVRATADAMQSAGVEVAPWVLEMLAAGHESFYVGNTVRDPTSKSYVRMARDPRRISLGDYSVVRENAGAVLRDLRDGVLCLEFRTKMRTLDGDVRAMLVAALDELESGDWVGLVIGNEGDDFCVGANLKLLTADTTLVDAAVTAVQDALMRIRFSTKPVVAAPFGRTLGGGTELSMAAARIVAAAETYMGLPEVSIGIVPGAGGCKEMIRRVVSPVMKRAPGADPLPLLQSIMQTVGAAKVSTSAVEARAFGFLGEADRLVMNRDHLLFEAKQEVLEMAAAGYAPPLAGDDCYAAGRGVHAGVEAGIYILEQGGYISAYDAHVSRRLAWVLCCGDLSAGQWVSERYLLDLERRVFIELLGETKTIERIQYMLETGKPLRN